MSATTQAKPTAVKPPEQAGQGAQVGGFIAQSERRTGVRAGRTYDADGRLRWSKPLLVRHVSVRSGCRRRRGRRRVRRSCSCRRP
jgi:hypothetical protein